MIIELDFRYDELKCIKGWHDICFANNKFRRNEIDERVAVKLQMMIKLFDQENDDRNKHRF